MKVGDNDCLQGKQSVKAGSKVYYSLPRSLVCYDTLMSI